MEGDGIIDVRADPFLCQELSQAVSLRNTDHILMKDMAVLILNGGELKTFYRREKGLGITLDTIQPSFVSLRSISPSI